MFAIVMTIWNPHAHAGPSHYSRGECYASVGQHVAGSERDVMDEDGDGRTDDYVLDCSRLQGGVLLPLNTGAVGSCPTLDPNSEFHFVPDSRTTWSFRVHPSYWEEIESGLLAWNEVHDFNGIESILNPGLGTALTARSPTGAWLTTPASTLVRQNECNDANGLNCIYAGDITEDGADSLALATTIRRYSYRNGDPECSVRVNIVYDQDRLLSAAGPIAATPSGKDPMDDWLTVITMHETGHALGFDHAAANDRDATIMYEALDAGQVFGDRGSTLITDAGQVQQAGWYAIVTDEWYDGVPRIREADYLAAANEYGGGSHTEPVHKLSRFVRSNVLLPSHPTVHRRNWGPGNAEGNGPYWACPGSLVYDESTGVEPDTPPPLTLESVGPAQIGADDVEVRWRLMPQTPNAYNPSVHRVETSFYPVAVDGSPTKIEPDSWRTSNAITAGTYWLEAEIHISGPVADLDDPTLRIRAVKDVTILRPWDARCGGGRGRGVSL